MSREVVVFLAHPYAPIDEFTSDDNIANAKAWYRFLIEHLRYATIIANWIVTCDVLDDTNKAHRLRGVQDNAMVISRVDEVWICGGTISSGMRNEMMIAASHKKPILDFTRYGRKPPSRKSIEDDTVQRDGWGIVAENGLTIYGGECVPADWDGVSN